MMNILTTKVDGNILTREFKSSLIKASCIEFKKRVLLFSVDINSLRRSDKMIIFIPPKWLKKFIPISEIIMDLWNLKGICIPCRLEVIF